MTSQASTAVCGLPTWIAFPPANDSTSYINDTVALAVNIPMSIFAFVSNLTIIVIVTRTPQLRTPSNILLCSLAATDCLQGMTSQPLFYIWRLMLHRARQSCDYQIELFEGRYVFNTLTSGWSFATLTLISFDRALALSKPLFYLANVTNEGNNNNNIIIIIRLITLGSIYSTNVSGAEQLCLKQISQIELNRVKNPNWLEANQLAIFTRMVEDLNSRLL